MTNFTQVHLTLRNFMKIVRLVLQYVRDDNYDYSRLKFVKIVEKQKLSVKFIGIFVLFKNQTVHFLQLLSVLILQFHRIHLQIKVVW